MLFSFRRLKFALRGEKYVESHQNIENCAQEGGHSGSRRGRHRGCRHDGLKIHIASYSSAVRIMKSVRHHSGEALSSRSQFSRISTSSLSAPTSGRAVANDDEIVDPIDTIISEAGREMWRSVEHDGGPVADPDWRTPHTSR